MQRYLETFRNYAASHGTSGASCPDGLCPLLYYNLLPYIICVAGGTRFGWARYHKDSFFRKKADARDFVRKDVNRLYPNEVLVCCPNASAGVVAGIGMYGADKIKIRILSKTGTCQNGHSVLDEFLLDKNRAIEDAKHFNMSFTDILVGAFSRSGKDAPSDAGPKISVDTIISPCRYVSRKRQYDKPLLPGGFCIHLFQYIYSEILSFMYSPDMKKELSASCKCQNGPITICLIKKNKMPAMVERIIDAAESVFEALFYPFDRLDYDMYISVGGKTASECGLISGKPYMINMRRQDHLCPSSVHTIYPYLMLAKKGGRVNWDEDDSKKFRVPCPDCIGTIYSIGEVCH